MVLPEYQGLQSLLLFTKTKLEVKSQIPYLFIIPGFVVALVIVNLTQYKQTLGGRISFFSVAVIKFCNQGNSQKVFWLMVPEG